MAQFQNIYPIDLNIKKKGAQELLQPIGEGDANGVRVGAQVFADGAPVTLNGQCVAKVIRADGSTVPLTGTISGNIASVALDQQSCAVEGPIQVAVMWVSGTNVTTLVIAYGTIVNTISGTIIQPSTPIPDLTQLLAEIDAMRQATAAANAAATKAVRYNEAQSLTDTEKARARGNISAPSAADLAALADGKAVRYDTAQTLVPSKMRQGRDNLNAAETMEGNIAGSYLINPLLFQRGSLDQGNITTAQYRVVTKHTHVFSFPVTFIAQAGFRFSLDIYTNDGYYYSTVDWTTTNYTLAKNQNFRMTIARVTDIASETADIDAFASGVHMLANQAAVVHYNVTQTLTAAERKQARDNIGAPSAADLAAEAAAREAGDAELKSALYDKIIYVGKGNTFAEYTYDGRLRPGHSYRVYVKLWDTTGITVTTGIMFRLGYTSNGTATYLHTVYGNDSSVLEEFYDVNIPDNAVNPMFIVGGRATGIAILGIENGELVLDPVFHSEVDPLKSGIIALMFGNAPTKQKVVGKRRSSSSAYSVMQINVESGRRYRIDMSNIDALVGANLYLRVRKADDSGNAYTATKISGDIPANTKWTYYFNCTVTESVVVQIYREALTEDAIFSVGVLCDDDRRDISTLTSDFSFINEKVNMDVSRNLTGPDLDVLYPIPPLNDNDVITISAFNPANVNSYTQVYFYEEDGTRIKYYQFDYSYASAGRRITLNLDGKTAYFIKFFHDCGSPLMVERGTKTDFIPHYTTNYEKYLNSNSSFGEFELFLPEQAVIIRNNLATARMAKRLCFGHVSDNHSTVEKFISDIVDMSDAKFIANTGDIVQDKFQDAYTNLPAMINAMTKPYYITLGNHDVYKAPSISDIFNKYFAPIIDHNGQTGLNKTYYSVDFTDEGIKCIFLDLYDAIADYSVSMETVIAGKMSATQINWFLGQLDAALASHMHVCVFLHLSPEMIGEKELKFFDVNTTESRKVTYTFIPDVIDAFLDGGSVTFNYDGSSYTHTFASSGVFVGYFCGHMHCDCIGKLKTHNRQNAFSVTRPWQSSATNTLTDGTYRHGSSKWGANTFNYVTVDPTTRHVSVMRVLQQETKYGFKRDFVTMEY